MYLTKAPAIMIDIDGTLAKEVPLDHDGHGYTFQHPYQDKKVRIIPLQRNIDILKNSWGRQRAVIVWSAAGHAWARAVIEVLQLEVYIDIIMEKPVGYVDDQDCSAWMGHRIWLAD